MAVSVLVFGFLSSTYRDARAADGTWSQIQQLSGSTPSARKSPAGCYDSQGIRMIIFGGENADGTLRNDVWALSLDTSCPQWTQIAVYDTLPPPRKEHRIIYDPVGNRVLLFGGEGEENDEDVIYGDLWALNLANNTWSQPPTTGTPACPREGHTAVYDQNAGRMVIFAGEIETNPNPIYTSSTFYVTLSTGGWGKHICPQEDAYTCGSWNGDPCRPVTSWPGYRWYQAAIWDPASPGRMIIHGGSYDGGADNETWVWSGTWSQASPSGGAARTNHRAIYDSGHQRMVIFAGEDTGGNPQSDVYALNLPQLTTWSQLTLSGPTPGARAYYAVAYDPNNDRMVVFGGESNGTKLGDTWQLRFGTDAIPPATTNDLDVVSVGSGVKLKWSAPGNDGTCVGRASSYSVRYRSDGPITESNWSTSTVATGPSGPSTPGVRDSITISLSTGYTWYVALKSTDAASNSSGISNNVCIKLTTDTTAPATTTDLNVSSISGGVKFKWTAPGDDGSSGCEAKSYEIRKRSGSEITAANWPFSPLVSSPLPSGPTTPGGGVKDSITIGLSTGVYWYVALKTSDWAGNVSGVSNNACIKLGNPPDYCDGGLSAIPAREEVWPARDLSIVALYPNPAVEGVVEVSFTLADASPAALKVFDLAGRLVENRDIAQLGRGTHTLTIGTRTKLAPGHYRVRIAQNRRSVTRSVVVIR